MKMRGLFLTFAACSMVVFVLGCGQKKQSSPGASWTDFENFTPVGTWSIADNQFTFKEDGTFTRAITGPNPQHYSWKGEWRREGRTIYAKVTSGVKNDIGKSTDFVIADADTMNVYGWGVFDRKK